MNRLISRTRRGILSAVLALVPALPAAAQETPVPFDLWLKELRAEATSRGIRASTIEKALDGVKSIPRVIELDRKQPEFTLTFRQYMDRVVPESRIEKGRQRLRENRALLEGIGRKYGVQPRFIVAFWGIETDFGRLTGGFPVIPALVTLAYDGRRSAYFRGELLHALDILDKDHIKLESMIGSWAGAMGQTQFMPSSFVAYAVDHDGDGRKDIWNSTPDALASGANYLARHGWKGDQTWGRPVTLPGGFDTGARGPRSPQALERLATDGRQARRRRRPAAARTDGVGGPGRRAGRPGVHRLQQLPDDI